MIKVKDSYDDSSKIEKKSISPKKFSIRDSLDGGFVALSKNKSSLGCEIESNWKINRLLIENTVFF